MDETKEKQNMWNSVRELKLYRCDNLDSDFLEKMGKLEVLKVHFCHRLFNKEIKNKFEKLQIIDIYGCKNVHKTNELKLKSKSENMIYCEYKEFSAETRGKRLIKWELSETLFKETKNMARTIKKTFKLTKLIQKDYVSFQKVNPIKKDLYFARIVI